MDDDNKQECFFCKDISITFIPFSCHHQICVRCIIQKIFCYQINELNNVSQIGMKCICREEGNLSLTLQQLNDLFIDYKRTTELKELQCKDHKQTKGHYCKECNHLICLKCLEESHSSHRVELKANLAKKIRNLLPNMSMSLQPFEVFEAKFNEISSKFEKDVTVNFKSTMLNIGSLIKSLQNLQESYNSTYVKLIEKGVYNLKLVKQFYSQFYVDLKEADKSEDINALRYLNNISFFFKKIETVHDQEVDRVINEIKLKVDEMKKITEPLKIFFEYDEVPRSYRCTNIVSKAHPELIKSVIQLQDETIITGGNDSTIKLWKDNGNEYTNISYIKKLVGKRINALLEINDNRILSSTELEGNIKIWKQNNNSYTVQQSLSHHETNVTCLVKFPDQKLASGSTDKTVVVFKEVEEDSFNIIATITQINEQIYGLLPLDNQRLIIQTATKLHFYKESPSKNGSEFEPDNVFEMPFSSSENMMIKTMCLIRDNKIAFSGTTRKIYILSQDTMALDQTLEKHSGEVNAVIQLRDGNLASASQDHLVIIWANNKDNKFEVHYVISDYYHGLYSLIELKDGQLCASCSHNCLIFWRNRNNYY